MRQIESNTTHASTHTRKTKPIGFDTKLSHSIELLKKAETMALTYSESGFYLAFSGGKDSLALYYVAKLAKVKFVAHYSLTTIDPPELVRFIKSRYPDVIIDLPELTFAKLCLKKKALPSVGKRFCCNVLKETKGANTVTITGVRRQESKKRSRRNEAEITSPTISRRKSGTFEQLDQFNRSCEIDGVHCIKGQDKIVLNPIIEWSIDDVWYFLNEVVNAEHCILYDRGWERIGCLFCPMSRKKEMIRYEKEYPKYKDIYLRTIHRLRGKGYMTKYKDLTDEEVFKWYISKQTMKKWYAENKLQQKIFKEEDYAI